MQPPPASGSRRRAGRADHAATACPRVVSPGFTTGDQVFRRRTIVIGVLVLVITGASGLFLGYQWIPILQRYGLGFFTEDQWQPENDIIGISSTLLGTLQVALLALSMAFPLALGTALSITEYAPGRIRSALVSLIDLMAAIPSIVWGLWGFFLIQPHAKNIARWLTEYAGLHRLVPGRDDDPADGLRRDARRRRPGPGR